MTGEKKVLCFEKKVDGQQLHQSQQLSLTPTH
jgi:hypothetical protein